MTLPFLACQKKENLVVVGFEDFGRAVVENMQENGISNDVCF